MVIIMHATEARLARSLYNSGLTFPDRHLLEYIFKNIRESSERGSNAVCLPLMGKWTVQKCKDGLKAYLNTLDYDVVFSESDGYHGIKIE